MTGEKEFVPLNNRGVDTIPPMVSYEPGDPPYISHFYRPETQIPRALDYALASYREGGGKRQFTALSVGCSFGPEVDTILSEVNRQAPELGSIVVRGYDPNPELIDYARAATYIAVVHDAQDEQLLGEFDVSPINFPEEYRHPLTFRGTHYVRSGKLRSAHDVDFVEANFGSFAEDSPDDKVPEADLIVCSRVLEHLEPDSVRSILAAIDRHLRPGGILDIGDTLGYEENFDDIVAAVSNLGYEPLLYSNSFIGDFPFILRKPHTAQPSAVNE